MTDRERFILEALGKLPRAIRPKPERLPIVWARTGDLVVACEDIQFDGEKEPRVKASGIGRIEAQKDYMSKVRWRNGRRFWLSNTWLDKCLMVREGNGDDAGQGWATENASPAVKAENERRFRQTLREIGEHNEKVLSDRSRFGWGDDPEGDFEIGRRHWDFIPDDWEN